MIAISIPPFFEIERGFYKSSAAVYLFAALTTAIGMTLLALRSNAAPSLSTSTLWLISSLWLLYSVLIAIYLTTLWNENGYLRARLYTVCSLVGFLSLVITAVSLKPSGLGGLMSGLYCVAAVASSWVLGVVSVGMLFGHWYLIDPNLPVDHLRRIVRVLGRGLAIEVIAISIA